MSEFQVGTLTLRSKTIPARKQFHVVRRLAPLLAHLGDLAGLASDTRDEAAVLKAAGTFGQALAELTDEAADYVLDAALAAAEVQQSDGGWAALRANGATMFPLDMPGELSVAFHVLRANLAGFIDALSATGLAAGRSNRPAGG